MKQNVSTSKPFGRVLFPTRGIAYLFERLKDFAVAALAQVKVRLCWKIVILGLCKSWGVASLEMEGGMWSMLQSRHNTYAKRCPSFMGPRMNQAVILCQLFCPPQACSVLLCSCLELPTSYTPSGQHLSPLPRSFAFVSTAITASDSYQVEDELTPKKTFLHTKKACYIHSSHVCNNLWVCGWPW